MTSFATLALSPRAAAFTLSLLAASPALAQTLCSTGVAATTPAQGVTYAISTQHTFTVPCSGRASTLVYTPTASSDDFRSSGYTLRAVLRSGDGTVVLATSDATDQWYPGATVTFDLTSANVPLVAGTTYRWELVSDRATSEGFQLYLLPVATTNPYANGQLYQDGATAAANDARGWTVNVTAALPVELLSFTGVASGRTARLAWTTASETDNAGFTVERQTGTAWTAASGLIAGRGTTSERTDYTHAVEGLTAGRHVFRLRQTDLDGTSVVAGTVSVEIGTDGPGAVVTVLGNGTRRPVVRIEAEGAVRAEAYDVLGRSVGVVYDGAVSGTVEASLPAGVAPGIYAVRVTTAGGRTTSHAVVVR